MNKFQTDIIRLVKSALTGEKYYISENIDWQEVLNFSKKHSITALIYYGIKNSNISLTHEIENSFMSCIYLNVVIDNNQQFELKELKRIFTEEKIDFAPLKGCRIKNYFPKSEMRSMSDLDILFRPEQIKKAKELIIARGYTFKTETDHVFEFSKENCLNLELHKKPIPSTEAFGNYYQNCWQLFHPVKPDSNEYIMNPSDEYIFLFLHFTKHYINGGVGIRQLLDLWIFAEREKIDFEYVEKELFSLQLSAFWKNICRTLKVWFESEKSDEKTDFITEFIFSSGVFGNHKAYLIVNAIKSHENPNNAGKRRIIRLFFLPYSGMCIKYPILKKLPVLLPLYWIIRLFDALLFKRKTGVMHLKAFSDMNASEIRNAVSEFNYVGLDFNFKE